MTTYSWEKKESAGSWVPFDGTPNVQNPTEEFAEGTWDIRVTVSDNGQTAQETKTAYVEVTGGSSYTGPLDLVPGASFAYSFRALRAAWLGQNVVRLRRDDAELNFACHASTGEFPTAAAIAWRDAEGAADAFVVTWFDQSGNGKDVTQAVANSQPLWVPSLANSKPGFFCDGATDADDRLISASNVSIGAENTFIAVARAAAPVGANCMFGQNSREGESWFEFSMSDDGLSLKCVVTDSDGDPVITALGASNILTTLQDFYYANAAMGAAAGHQVIRVNGAAIPVSAGEGTIDSFAVPIVIGDSDASVTAPWDGDILEVIGYASELSLANRQAIEEDQGTFYAIP